MDFKDLSWRVIFKVLGTAAVAVTLLGLLFVLSGVYNVAASRDHLGVTTWLLEKARDRSIATYSMGIEPPPLDDDGMIRLGAAHYEGACAPCHNRPGGQINAIASRMLPSPPELTQTARERDAAEIFWIVKHGLKYTGMPAWPSELRDDEVWAVTAFVSQVPRSGKAAYADQAGITRLPAEASGSTDMQASTVLAQCDRCHDGRGLATNGDRIPRLAGQTEAYLARSLREYAGRLRPSGVMQPVADGLGQEEIDTLARHYAGLQPQPNAVRVSRDPEQIRRGRELAERGDPQRDVPACMSCHLPGRNTAFPALAGQHAKYTAAQLRLWQRGGRDGTTHGRIMAPVARRMTEEQVIDVSAYYASLPAWSGGEAAEATP